jgi:hypothetical protein
VIVSDCIFINCVIIGLTTLTNSDSEDSLGQDTAFLNKYDTNGTFQWTVLINGSDGSSAEDVFLDHDGVIVVGDWSGELIDHDGDTVATSDVRQGFVAKYSSSGDPDYIFTVGNNGTGTVTIFSGKVDPSDGNLIIGGIFEDSINLGDFQFTSSGSQDVFIAKITQLDGNVIWAQAFGGEDKETLFDLDVNENGVLCASGQFSGDSEILNTTYSAAPDSLPAFVLELNTTDGSQIWIQVLNSSKIVTPWGVSISNVSNCRVAGSFSEDLSIGDSSLASNSNETSMFYANLGPLGESIVLSSSIGEDPSNAYDIACDNDDNCWITGEFVNSITFNPDEEGEGLNATTNRASSFVARLDPDGSPVYVLTEEAEAQSSFGVSVDIDNSNAVYVAGSYVESIQWGDFNLTSDSTDTFRTYIIKVEDNWGSCFNCAEAQLCCGGSDTSHTCYDPLESFCCDGQVQSVECGQPSA